MEFESSSSDWARPTLKCTDGLAIERWACEIKSPDESIEIISLG
jgi:hypothetical protein